MDNKTKKQYDSWKLDNGEVDIYDKNCIECGTNIVFVNKDDFDAVSFCDVCYSEKVSKIIREQEGDLNEKV